MSDYHFVERKKSQLDGKYGSDGQCGLTSLFLQVYKRMTKDVLCAPFVLEVSNTADIAGTTQIGVVLKKDHILVTGVKKGLIRSGY